MGKIKAFNHKKDEIDHFADIPAYIIAGLIAFIFIVLVRHLWPSHLPFRTFEFFDKCNLNGALIACKWMFLWVGSITLLSSFLGLNSKFENINAEKGLLEGMLISLKAGIFEELYFRWLMFMVGMVTVQIVNWIFLGFMGLYPIEWLNTHVVVPIADFMTFYQVSEILRTTPWFIAAGILAALAQFRDGHKYLGIIGFINSWYIGLFLFYIMLTYGLVPAIIVHILYDMIYFFVRYLDCVLERKLEIHK